MGMRMDEDYGVRGEREKGVKKPKDKRSNLERDRDRERGGWIEIEKVDTRKTSNASEIESCISG